MSKPSTSPSVSVSIITAVNVIGAIILDVILHALLAVADDELNMLTIPGSISVISFDNPIYRNKYSIIVHEYVYYNDSKAYKWMIFLQPGYPTYPTQTRTCGRLIMH